MIQLDQEMKQLARTLVGIEQMSLHFKPLGNWPELKDELLSAAVEPRCYRDVDEIRTRDVFIAVANDGWRRLTIAGGQLMQPPKRFWFDITRLPWLFLARFHLCFKVRCRRWAAINSPTS